MPRKPAHATDGPSTDRPGSERLLHAAEPNAALTLWLADECCSPAASLLTVKDDDAGAITGTGEEWADIARAILAHVKQPSEEALALHYLLPYVEVAFNEWAGIERKGPAWDGTPARYAKKDGQKVLVKAAVLDPNFPDPRPGGWNERLPTKADWGLA